MLWLRFAAILLVLDAIIILIRPDYVKNFIGLLADGAKIYFAAIIKACLGLIFLFGASSRSNIPWIIITFGVLALGGAVFIIAIPQKARKMAKWFASLNYFMIRLFAIIYLFIAALLVYAA
jgi:uncharacterized protein YjeT (DUF2065 family)